MYLGIPQLYKIREISQETPNVKSFKFLSYKAAKEFIPGQYVLLWVYKPKECADEIPISIASANYPYFEVAVAKVGETTAALHEKRVGDKIGIRGPFGNGFSFRGQKFCLVGGGYGNAPLLFFAESVKKLDAEVTVVIGAKTADDLLYKPRFEKLGYNVLTTTEDGSDGHKGKVTELLPELFKKVHFDQVKTCGPELMMKEVLDIAKRYKIPIEASVERRIKCPGEYSVCGSCDLGGIPVCRYQIRSGKELEDTEFAIWYRDETGRRIPFKGDNISSPYREPIKVRKDPWLSYNVFGIEFPIVVGNSSGIRSSSSLSLYNYVKEGAGFLVTKSVGLNPRRPFPGPNFIVYQGRPINAFNMPNPGIENFKIEIEDLKRWVNVPVIVSIIGGNTEEVVHICKRVEEIDGDAIEWNPACPHDKETSWDDPNLIEETGREIKKHVDIPVIVKLSPQMKHIKVAKAAEEAGLDGVTVSNTLRVFPKYPKLEIPMLGNISGGESGINLRKKSLQMVREIYEEVNIPIIGCGGISSGKYGIEYIENGSSLLQVGVACIDRYAIRTIENQMREHLVKNEIDNIREIIGIRSKK